MLCSRVVGSCEHAHHEYKNYIHLVYTLENVSNVYRGLFGKLCNEAYWPCGSNAFQGYFDDAEESIVKKIPNSRIKIQDSRFKNQFQG